MLINHLKIKLITKLFLLKSIIVIPYSENEELMA